MESTASIEIARPIQDVFSYTLEKVPEWSIIVVEDELLEEKNGGGVGTTFRTVTEERGRRMEFQGVVTAYDPPRLSSIRLVGQYFDIEATYRFEEIDPGHTRVSQDSSVQGKGFTKLMFLLFGWAMRKSSCKAANDELESLKSKLEAQV